MKQVIWEIPRDKPDSEFIVVNLPIKSSTVDLNSDFEFSGESNADYLFITAWAKDIAPLTLKQKLAVVNGVFTTTLSLPASHFGDATEIFIQAQARYAICVTNLNINPTVYTTVISNPESGSNVILESGFLIEGISNEGVLTIEAQRAGEEPVILVDSVFPIDGIFSQAITLHELQFEIGDFVIIRARGAHSSDEIVVYCLSTLGFLLLDNNELPILDNNSEYIKTGV